MVGFARTHMRCDLDLTRTQHSRLTPHQVSKGSNMKVSGLSSHQAPRRFEPWVIGAAHLASASWLCAEDWRGAAPPPAPRQQPARPWLSCLAKHSEELERRVEELENSIEEAAKRIGAQR